MKAILFSGSMRRNKQQAAQHFFLKRRKLSKEVEENLSNILMVNVDTS